MAARAHTSLPAETVSRGTLPLRLAGYIAPALIVGLSMIGCTGSSDGSGAADAEVIRAPWCPRTLPEAGAACTPATLPVPDIYLACEYGVGPHCTAVATCASSDDYKSFQWSVNPPDPNCGGGAETCPSAVPANGGACAVGASCSYESGRCSCLVCEYSTGCGNPCGDQDGGTEWSCRGWEQQLAGCPEPRPLIGTSCSVPMQRCGGYPDPAMECVDGYWVAFIAGGC